MSKKKIIFLTLSIFLVISVLLSSSYALLFKTDITDKQSYTTGVLDITSETLNGSVTINNQLPMTDSDGANTTPYIFRITNTGNLNYKFNVMLLSTTTENQIEAKYIKIKVDDNEITKLSDLTDGIILSDITLKPNDYIDISLRVWLDENTPNNQIGKTFNAKITTEGQAVYVKDDLALKTLTNLGLIPESTILTTFTVASRNDDTTGIYKSEDDLGTSYYFRGNVTNNYVYFAGFYWRIIRINGDGTVRMIYDGTSAHGNSDESEDRQMGTSAYNENYDDNAYVGYMYGTANSTTYEATHANTNDSTIKTYLDNWYNTNIKNTTNEQYIADAIYCNDRTRVTDSKKMSNISTSLNFSVTATGEGYGINITLYGFLNRHNNDLTSVTPSLKCEQANDRFTVNTTIDEVPVNGKLTNPIGLITLDEMVYGGSVAIWNDNITNDETYLYNGENWYWSITPFALDMDNAIAGIGYNGTIGYDFVDFDYFGVRGVITLTADALNSGTGTMTDPFKVDAAKKILTNLGLTANTNTPDFSKTSCSSGCDESTVGIYEAEDDLGTSYYFRGDVENNYVYFAGYYWRIVRINGDGSIRMIYDGTSAHANGESSTDRQIGTSTFNNSVNHNAYVGYMYGATGTSSTYTATHRNTNNSTIKNYLDNWYNTNIKGTVNEQYVADAIYCNDREVSSGTGAAKTDTYYKTYERLVTNKTPILKCSQENDRFTVNVNINGVAGNGVLTNPIGLITADEVSYSGVTWDKSNTNYYLYTGNYFWTSSPFRFNGSNAYEFNVYSSGGFNYVYVNYSTGIVRPVITLTSTALTKGTGTMTDPFKIN